MKAYRVRVSDGYETKFKRDDKEFTLNSFADASKRHMETHGMDTCFYTKSLEDEKPLFLFD